MSTVIEICKLYDSTKTTPKDIVELGVEHFFPEGCTLSCWDNDRVSEDEQLTTAQISALNEDIENQVKRIIIAKNLMNSPAVDLTNEKYLIYGKWQEVKSQYEQAFRIQLRKFDPIWFHDYDIYHEGDTKRTDNLTTTLDLTDAKSGNDKNYAETLTGNYPNNSNGNLYATSKSETNSTTTYNSQNDTDGTTKNTGTVTGEDDWHEWRIGAMGRSPNFVQKEAYNNIYNLVGDMAREFDKYFRFEWEKFDERCVCEW